MEFKDYLYVRPNLEEIAEEFSKVVSIINEATECQEVFAAVDAINKVRNTFSTMQTLASIRYTINSLDEFYSQENDFFDENGPKYSEWNNNFMQALYNCKFRDELVDRYGKRLFEMIKTELETFSPEIIPHLQKEGKLTSQYGKLIASAKITFDGKELNLSQMRPYLISPNRETRKNAETVMWKYFEDNVAQFDEIYDELVKVRAEMAKKLGYKSFIELAYKRLGRTEYNDKDVASYRRQVLTELVPLASTIYQEQALRLGIEELKSYDLNLEFLTGNPTPIGDVNYKVAQAKKMYHEMSNETKEFIDFMIERNTLDLEAKPGKQGGGYCTYISDYQSPFIFSNFNGTSGDINVLTHEFGHAFQVYCSRGFEVNEYMFPTLEACEIHSMSMEFFAWPWIESFFGADTNKYKYSHLSSSITFIPYGVAVDEFQHIIYENPNLTSDERKQVWRKMEMKYTPWKIYDNQFLEKGNFWIKQSHIYEVPFYYIDYTLAQNCAHQFFIKNNQNHEKAWADYLNLCKLGGSKSFLELLKVAHLENPFIDGTLKKVSEPLKQWLDQFDMNLIK